MLFAWTICWMLSFPNATKRKTLFRVLNSGKKFSSAGSLKLMNKESVFHSRPIRRICRENSIFEYRGKVKLNISTFYKIQKTIFQFWVYFKTHYKILFGSLRIFVRAEKEIKQSFARKFVCAGKPQTLKIRAWMSIFWGMQILWSKLWEGKHGLMCTQSWLQWMPINFLKISMRTVFKRI